MLRSKEISFSLSTDVNKINAPIIPYASSSNTNIVLVEKIRRENLIPLDHFTHVNGTKRMRFEDFKQFCNEREDKCDVIRLGYLTADEINDLYATDCVNGIEGSAIGAALIGVLVLTKYCRNGGESHPFPIPRDHIMYSDRKSMLEVADILMKNFEDEQIKQEGFRKLYRNDGENSLTKQKKRFDFLNICQIFACM